MEEMQDINIGANGEVLPPKNDKILLVDADTIVVAAVTVCTVVEPLLPKEMYTEDEWLNILSDPTYNEEEQTVSFLNVDEAFEHGKDTLDLMLERTGCQEFELHFSQGRESIGYKVDKEYKANRKKLKPIFGLDVMKKHWLAKYPDKCTINTKWEADHIVVCKKRDFPDKYILAAVDKDVLLGVPGKHFDYYKTRFHFVTVEPKDACRRYYVQCMSGDASDGIKGIPGIGPKKAEKALEGLTNEIEYWTKVIEMYESKGLSIVDAVTNMRLVNMNQLELNKNNEYEVKLWRPVLLEN